MTGRRQRDLRLDFFRGMAMFIILLAHTPGNAWTLWIPARFGFSDATEMFVFCSGMASALAFGAVFARAGFGLGTARIGLRVWQVYWAHIGVFLVTAVMLFAIDHFSLGNKDTPYIHDPWVVPLFEQTGEALVGLFTLTYVPGLFDILPMYLVILAMIPGVMLAHRLGGRWTVLALMAGTWLAANLAGLAREADWSAILGDQAGGAGAFLSWMNLPSLPWGDLTWFFNPFAWQLVFFTGFCFGMGWLRPPPVRRWLVLLAAAYVIGVIPFAWYQIHSGFYLPDDLTVLGFSPHGWIAQTRDALEPLWWKTWLGLGRYLHFLAIAYLAWVAVGPGGRRLNEGYDAPPAPGRIATAIAAFACLAFWPHVLVYELHRYAPGLEGWLLRHDWMGLTHVAADGAHLMAHPSRVGLWQLLFGIGAAVLLWRALGPRLRAWLCRDALVAAVPVIRKVGTQSLAVFMTSIPLARLNGLILDHIGRDVWTWWLVNGWGFAILVAVAYFMSWIKRQPWRESPQARSRRPEGDGPAPAGAASAARPAGGVQRGGRLVPAQRP